MRSVKRIFFVGALLVSVSFAGTNCSSTKSSPVKPAPTVYNSTEQDYIEKYKKAARTYKIGRPYKILGNMFYPGHQPNYNEVGVASWYGPNVDQLTANGELFDINEMAAAHPTLPLPSIVEVTNLDNGRKVVVKVNDRGPFKKNRIIDLTEEAARRIGMLDSGVANVRVSLLQEETLDYLVYDH